MTNLPGWSQRALATHAKDHDTYILDIRKNALGLIEASKELSENRAPHDMATFNVGFYRQLMGRFNNLN